PEFFVPQGDDKTYLEAAFALVYHGKFALGEIMLLNREDFKWYYKRLQKQKEDETASMKRAMGSKGKR
ncbi:unnamed protein product, partial [marine sediment metagenome]